MCLRSKAAACAMLAAVTLVSCSETETAPATAIPADADHVALTRWLVSEPFPGKRLPDAQAGGPYRSGYETDYLAPLGGERHARLTPESVVASGDDTVRFSRMWWTSDYLDLARMYGTDDTPQTAYLYTEVESDTTREMFLHAGTNDAGKVWVGDSLVIAFPGDRAAHRSQETARITLPEGRTRLLVKLDQGGGGWGAYIDLYSPEAHEQVLAHAYPPPRPTPDNIAMTFGSNPETSRRIAWRTDTGTEGSVIEIAPSEVGESLDWGGPEVRRIEGESEVIEWRGVAFRTHAAEMTGLAPGHYVYRVGSGREGEWSGDVGFLVPTTEGRITFVVLGDSRTNMMVWHDIMAAAAVHAPSFIVHSGDLVDSGRRHRDWSLFFREAPALLASVPFMSVIGNHEGGPPLYHAMFALPRQAPADSLMEECWSFDYGPMHWVGLNSYRLPESQTEWLRDDLAATNKPWRFAVFHHPAYSGHQRRGDGNLEVRSEWCPVFDEYGVAAAWQGHDHYYMRTKAISGGEIVEQRDGTVHVTTGGAGAPPYAVEENRWTAAAAWGHHYVLAELERDSLWCTVYDLDDEVIDRFSMAAPN